MLCGKNSDRMENEAGSGEQTSQRKALEREGAFSQSIKALHDGDGESAAAGAGSVEKLTDQYDRLVLGCLEDELLLDDEDEAEPDPAAVNKGVDTFPLVSTILTDKVVKFQIFWDLMVSLWCPGKGVLIQEIGELKRGICLLFIT
ncbi:unnamed protein product [Cuscuta europaea]|uniref:Uncharacterized protein n=1 Tax=Cuscuta europaea TaxID=41803 RepID=A0A9P0ZKQ1_CUSEU|nr:unnamed protein product [Cuscuta europaea]